MLPSCYHILDYTHAMLGSLATFGLVNWFIYMRNSYNGLVLDMNLVGVQLAICEF